MNALSSDDNLNASVQWGEDEMQAFGRVDAMMLRLGPSQEEVIFASLQVSGLGKFSEDDWKAFIALRSSLPSKIAKILQTCQFNACAGRVRVRPSDFGLTAKLDPRAPLAKVALMLFQYLSSMDHKSASGNALTFAGRRETFAKKLPSDVVNELIAEPVFCRTLHVNWFRFQLQNINCTDTRGPDLDHLQPRWGGLALMSSFIRQCAGWRIDPL